jgi:hypothetical protein
LYGKGNFSHIWNQFKALISNELGKNVMITEKIGIEGGGENERVYWIRQNWRNFNIRKKLIHMVLWVFYKKVTQRIQILWDERDLVV